VAKRIEVQIVGDASNLQRALSSATGSTGKFGSALGGLAKAGLFAAGAAGIGGLFVTMRSGIAEFSEAAKVTAQTNAVIKSTGAAANVTAKQVESLSQALSEKTGIDDEVIASGENMLLTFTRIHNEAGKGNDIFNQATKATLDLSVAMGKDMQGASILVGKALNDPIKGLTALTRVGVTFDEGQKKMIKSMVESGNVMGAQKLILEELNREFGGSAEAFGNTIPGQIRKLINVFDEFAAGIIARTIPTVQRFVGFLQDVFQAQGIRAKLSVVWEGIETVATELAAKITTAMASVDWSGVATSIANAVKGAIDASDAPVREAGNNLVEKINTAIKGADWSQIGNTMGLSLRQQIAQSMEANAASARTLSERIVDSIRTTLVKVPGLGVLMRIPTSTLAASFQAALATAGGFFAGLLGITRSNMARFIVAVGNGFNQAVAAVRAAVGQFAGAAAAVGRAIVDGIIGGIGGLASRLSSAISGAIGSALSSIDIPGFSPPEHAAAKAIGEPLGRGVINGWIKSSADLPEKMSTTLKNAIEKARAAIEGARDRLGSAFDTIRDRILRAFDAINNATLTPSEKIIKEIGDRRELEDALTAQTNAQIALNEAIASGDAAAIAAATRAKQRADEDVTLIQTRKDAAAERLELDSQNEEKRLALERRLKIVEAHFLKEGASVKKAMAAIKKIMADFDIDFESAGENLGAAFVRGLKKALAAGAKAAAAVDAVVPGASSFNPGPSSSGGGGNTFIFEAPVGSEREMQNWVVSALATVNARGGIS
jgi:hypothetical protein